MTGRPSSYLCELQQIASKVGAGEELVCHKFLQALPANIRPVLASQKTLISGNDSIFAQYSEKIRPNILIKYNLCVHSSNINFIKILRIFDLILLEY